MRTRDGARKPCGVLPGSLHRPAVVPGPAGGKYTVRAQSGPALRAQARDIHALNP